MKHIDERTPSIADWLTNETYRWEDTKYYGLTYQWNISMRGYQVSRTDLPMKHIDERTPSITDWLTNETYRWEDTKYHGLTYHWNRSMSRRKNCDPVNSIQVLPPALLLSPTIRPQPALPPALPPNLSQHYHSSTTSPTPALPWCRRPPARLQIVHRRSRAELSVCLRTCKIDRCITGYFRSHYTTSLTYIGTIDTTSRATF